jgi:tetratricopeptide (TPR) repeat protein
MSDAVATYREGFRLFADGRADAAIAKYREALAIDSQLAIAWNALSMALRQQGDIDGAVAAAKKLIELEPDDPLSHTNLSILFQMKGMIAEAEDERAQALQLEMKAQRNP